LHASAECCIRCNSARFSQDCRGGSYQSITGFMSALFKDGGDGILQFQDGTPALSAGQWSELDTALAKAPHPAAPAAGPPSPSPASAPATPSTAPSTPAGGNCAAA
jgi:hypothetical protein